MDRVPFVFCRSVLGAFSDPVERPPVFVNQNWTAAFREQGRRVKVDFFCCKQNGVWKYGFENLDFEEQIRRWTSNRNPYSSLAELQSRDDFQHVRIEKVLVYTDTDRELFDLNVDFPKLFNKALSMCCEPRLFFEGRLPLEDLEPLLRSLDNRSFSSIKIKHYNHAYDDLVRRHFSRNDKTTITVASDSWTEDELELFRSHVYSGDFWNLRISGNREHPFTSADFGLLFEKIWAMPRYPDNVFVMLDTVFERKAIEDIRVFRGDVRRQQNENSYFWQRDDGLCVVATIDEDEDMVMINSAFDGFESQH